MTAGTFEDSQPGAQYVIAGEDYDHFNGQHREVIDGLVAIKDALLNRPDFPPLVIDLSAAAAPNGFVTQRKYVIRKIVFSGPFTLSVGGKLFILDNATLTTVSIDFPLIVERGITLTAVGIGAQHCYVFGDMIESNNE